VWIAGAFLLSACASSNLIDLNNRYADLIHQKIEMEDLANKQPFSKADAAATQEGIQIQFADLGDLALKAAEDAERQDDKASFAYAAIRSYISSGPVKDFAITEASGIGLAACGQLNGEGTAGLARLPTTCGYFRIAEQVGINNELVRSRKSLKARTLDGPLPNADGPTVEMLANSFMGVFEGLTALEDAGPDIIDWQNADQGLKAYLIDQLEIAFCNAQFARALVSDVSAGSGWDGNDADGKLGAKLLVQKGELDKKRPGFVCKAEG
tara:strand:+ start:17042 stop:17845 length:804 start_codon:yes stop_codon:yes gene_type:complete